MLLSPVSLFFTKSILTNIDGHFECFYLNSKKNHASIGPSVPDNGPELSCPAEAGSLPPILAHACGPGASPYGTSCRVSFSELGTFVVIISVLLF
jgi:hypothetical protein